MTSDPEPFGVEPKRQLHTNARNVLVGWAVVAVGLTVYAFIESASDQDWGDLVRVLYLMFLAVALAVLALARFLIKRLVADPTAQTVAAVLGPPVLLVAAIFLFGVL